MACNCATQEQLDELYRKFGTPVKPRGTQKVSFWVKYYVNNILTALSMLFITPFLFIYVGAVSLFGGGKISLTKFFGIKRENLEEYATGNRQ